MRHKRQRRRYELQSRRGTWEIGNLKGTIKYE